ncbi:YicC/YloC family endoribonuclease [Stagnihabitans tardus]|uniref:YicC family protein n=1 Tax=Stagnihabitans tardus TaxID=2699202 RepID=A0AAE5BVG4_9RHOB|nr:YicC/YloC family endoribonuclease [Stagnihabitans tardus]NBZ87814.1 YicC family protein [Stagnihabitans tardus]
MTVSMTGFATAKGQGAGHSWSWEMRGVNGKGLDLRLRVPEWIDGLELALRAELTKALGRGNVSLTLKVSRDGMGEGVEGLRLNPAALSAALEALRQVEDAAMQVGVTLGQATAADVLTLRGVLDSSAAEIDTGALRAAILADLPGLLAAFQAMRASEGAALNAILGAALDRIAALVEEAAQAMALRADQAGSRLREAVARLLQASEGLDETRIAQELALLTVKNDITEEIDRLKAHVAAARALLADPGQVGRKFDFLVQEFLREANTLCSKAQSIELTRIGLDLKTVIDQMREQSQNVE